MRRAVWLVGLAVLASVATVAAALLASRPNVVVPATEPAIGQPVQPPAFFPVGLTANEESARAQAGRAAQEWASDAQLADVSALWNRPDERSLLEEPPAWTFVYYSPRRAALLFVSADSWSARVGREVAIGQPLPAIDLQRSTLGPGEAAMIFLESGGRSFLADHPGVPVRLFLTAGESGEPVWTFLALDLAGGAPFGVSVNAVSGEATVVNATTGGE